MDQQLQRDRHRLILLLRKAEAIRNQIKRLGEMSGRIGAQERKLLKLLDDTYDDIEIYRYKTNDFA